MQVSLIIINYVAVFNKYTQVVQKLTYAMWSIILFIFDQFNSTQVLKLKVKCHVKKKMQD